MSDYLHGVDSSKSMNHITKLLREQNTKDDLWCSALDRLEYTARNRNLFDHDGYQKEIQQCCEQAFNWHTTAQQQLIDVIIKYSESVIQEERFSGAPHAVNKIVTLLEEAKKNV